MFGVHKPEIGEFSQSIEELLVGFGIIDGPGRACPVVSGIYQTQECEFRNTGSLLRIGEIVNSRACKSNKQNQ